MESNFNISTKVNRVSMPTQNKVDTVMKNLGHRPCVAYSEEKDIAYTASGRQRKSIREVGRRLTQHAVRHPVGGCGRGLFDPQSRMEMLQTERTKERAPGS